MTYQKILMNFKEKYLKPNVEFFAPLLFWAGIVFNPSDYPLDGQSFSEYLELSSKQYLTLRIIATLLTPIILPISIGSAAVGVVVSVVQAMSDDTQEEDPISCQQFSHLLNLTKGDPLLNARIKKVLAELPPEQQAQARDLFPEHADLLPELKGDNVLETPHYSAH
jgi:hypothetical protein